MKKILLLIVITFLGGILAVAQKDNTGSKKNVLSITAGPSFPIGDFGSTNFDNDNAGMAKTGLTVNINYVHHYDKLFGLAADVTYGRNAFDEIALEGSEVSADPWQYYTVTVGPVITGNLTPKTSIDFSILSGMTYAKSPTFTSNLRIIEGDWSIGVPLKLAADFRYQFSKNNFFKVGANYLYMKPKFEYNAPGDNMSLRQKMEVLGINAGIGFSF